MCPFTRLSCPRGIQTSLSPPVALDLFSDLDEDCSLGVLSYEVSTSTLNEVFTKLEGNSMAEQGTSIRMHHGRPISKWSCVSLVSRVSCVWLSPRTRHIPDLTVLFGKGCQPFPHVVTRTKHRPSLAHPRLPFRNDLLPLLASVSSPRNPCFLDSLRMSEALHQGHEV